MFKERIYLCSNVKGHHIMVKIALYHEKYFTDLSSYELDEVQAQFTDLPRRILKDPLILNKENRFQYCILYNEKPAGFFSLDLSEDRFMYTDNPKSILLRAVSVMPQFQGKGVAKEAMLLLPSFVKLHFAEVNEIVFGVNLDNEVAYSLYLRSGYIDAGKIYEGIKGPQHVMSKNIVNVTP